MFECLSKILGRLEALMNSDDFGLRNTVLKAFSALINHCRHTDTVDAQIKKTRKGLQNICMDYIKGICTLYISDPEEERLL